MPIHSDAQVKHLQSHRPHPPRQERPSQQGGADGDRLRMRANCLSAVAVLALLLIGGWAENGLVNATRDNQDCYRPGRHDCTGVYIPAPPAALTQAS